MEKFSCLVCSKNFARQDSLNKHKKVHDKAHQCEICQKSFHRKLDLERHMRTHTGEKPYVCSICDKRFAQKSTLQNHQATHSDERNFKCKICPDDRYFKTNSQLSNHMIFHYEPSHQCEVCQKSFHCKSNLSRHMRTNTGEKP